MPSAGTTTKPSGLPTSLASLARNLLGATPTEATSPVSPLIRPLIRRPISGAGPNSPSQPRTSRNASSRLSGSTSGVKRKKISRICRLTCGVVAHAHRQEDGLRAQPPGRGHRHGAVDAARAGLVGGGADDAAAAQTADDDRPAAQLGPVPLLDRGVEGVHIDVQDRERGVGHAGLAGSLGSAGDVPYPNRGGARCHSGPGRAPPNSGEPHGERPTGQRPPAARPDQRQVGGDRGRLADAAPLVRRLGGPGARRPPTRNAWRSTGRCGTPARCPPTPASSWSPGCWTC